MTNKPQQLTLTAPSWSSSPWFCSFTRTGSSPSFDVSSYMVWIRVLCWLSIPASTSVSCIYIYIYRYIFIHPCLFLTCTSIYIQADLYLYPHSISIVLSISLSSSMFKSMSACTHMSGSLSIPNSSPHLYPQAYKYLSTYVPQMDSLARLCADTRVPGWAASR